MEDIKRVLGYGVHKIMNNPLENEDFVKVFKAVFNVTTCNTCRNEIYNNYFKLKNLTAEQLTIMKDSKENSSQYKLKDNIVLDTHFGDGVKVPMGHWTNDNITDEIAEKLIKGGYGKHFLNADGSEVEPKEGEDTQMDVNGDGKTDLSAKELKAKLIENGIPADDVKNMKTPALIALFKEKGFELK